MSDERTERDFLDEIIAERGPAFAAQVEMALTGRGTCTCGSIDFDCPCPICAALANFTAACPERLGAGIGLYDGMCDSCFTLAREVRDCGLRVAEHEMVR